MIYSWVAIAWISPELQDTLEASKYFSFERNPGFLKKIGITTAQAYRPWILKPSIEVWQEVVRHINRETKGNASGRSSLLVLCDEPEAPSRQYNFTIRFYRPAIVCVEIELLDDIIEEDPFFYRNLDNHKAARNALDYLLGILKSGKISQYSLGNGATIKTAMTLPVKVREHEFSDWKIRNKKYITGLLINNRNYDAADISLSDRIFEKNKEIDIKFSEVALSMVSKQGVLTCYPSFGHSKIEEDIKREHVRRFRFLEYALAIQKFLENLGNFRSKDREAADFLLYLCLPFVTTRANIPKTVTGTNTWRILAEEFSFERSLETVNEHIVREVEEKSVYYIDVDQKSYDSFQYKNIAREATSNHRNIVIKDAKGNNIIISILGLIATIIIGIATIYYS